MVVPREPHVTSILVNFGGHMVEVPPSDTERMFESARALAGLVTPYALPAGLDVFARTCEDVSLAGENHGMHASPFGWRDTAEQRKAMAEQAPVDSGRQLHGDEVEQALGAQGEDLGEALA